MTTGGNCRITSKYNDISIFSNGTICTINIKGRMINVIKTGVSTFDLWFFINRRYNLFKKNIVEVDKQIEKLQHQYIDKMERFLALELDFIENELSTKYGYKYGNVLIGAFITFVFTTIGIITKYDSMLNCLV